MGKEVVEGEGGAEEVLVEEAPAGGGHRTQPRACSLCRVREGVPREGPGVWELRRENAP